MTGATPTGSGCQSFGPQPAAPFSQSDIPSADARLWCLHHIGPDELHPAPNFATAQKWADWANSRFAEHADISRFVVALWPWLPDRHAGELERSIEEWTLPDRAEAESATFLQRLAGRARHLRDRGEVKTPELLEQSREALMQLYGWRERDWPEGFCRRTADLIAESVESATAHKLDGESDGGPVASGGLRESLSGFGDDYMTSENHHPGYVLIPTAQFERVRTALAAEQTKEIATAQGIEAATADETHRGSAVGESPVAESDAPETPLSTPLPSGSIER